MSDSIDITKKPEWICVSKFRDHPHGEYLVVLKDGYLTTAYFTYGDGGRINDSDGDITDSVVWFTPNRTTWYIRDSTNPDSVESLKRRLATLQKAFDAREEKRKFNNRGAR